MIVGEACNSGARASGFFQHPQAIVEEGARVGERTRVWAFAHVLSGAVIGCDCNISGHTFIEGGVRIGDRVTVKCAVSLWEGIQVENDVFIGPGAVFTNDKRPRSRNYPQAYLKTFLKEGCSIGANTTVLPGLTIGRWAMTGAGSVVTRNVPDHVLVYGNPATFHGWVCRCGQKLANRPPAELICICGFRYEISAAGVRKLFARTDVRQA
jgi:UDP-2-acetamido-3-amino-2,3-dideoxy-glucuronate N-acetyltransferase